MATREVTYGKAAYLAATPADDAIGPRIARIAFQHPSQKRWLIAFAGSVGLMLWLVVALGWLFYWGIGVWGNNIPVTWALDIVSYDWWMGNACGAILFSAILLLFRQYWRGALNRIADTVAVLSAAAAGIYPIVHLGRPWFFYWNIPYPNNLGLWPQFRSPLVWDAFDIISFLIIAVLLWFVGMVPDLAALRDRAPWSRRKLVYGAAALGWRGSAVHWARWIQTCRILALLAALQAICTQTGASVMYAGTVEPGWHDTLLPPFFVVNAVFSGIGLIAVIVGVVRYVYPVSDLITRDHLDMLARLLLAAGLMSTYFYCADFFFTALGGDEFDRAVMMRRFTGEYAFSFWLIVGAALLPIHLLWFRAARCSSLLLGAIGLLVSVAMWSDHFMVLVVTQHRDFLPSSQSFYTTTFWAVSTFAGTIGLFGVLLLLVVRYLPIASIVDTRLSIRARDGDVAMPEKAEFYGIAAEFETPEALMAGLEAMRDRAIGRLDALSPLPLAGAGEALGLRAPLLGRIALAAVLLGGFGCFAMILYATMVDYPFNVGGRPLFSWPSYVIPSFAAAMALGAIAVTAAMFFLDRLPRLNHPVFNIDGIEEVTQDRLFLVIEARSESFDPSLVERVLAELPRRPIRVQRVPR